MLEVTTDQVTFTLPTLFSFKTAMELQIFGEDLRVLRDLGQDAMAALENVKGLKDTDLSLKKGYPEIHIVLDRELLATKNLEAYQVAQMLRTEVQGDIATRFSHRRSLTVGNRDSDPTPVSAIRSRQAPSSYRAANRARSRARRRSPRGRRRGRPSTQASGLRRN